MKKLAIVVIFILVCGCYSTSTSVESRLQQQDEEMRLRQALVQMHRENNDLHRTIFRLENVIENQLEMESKDE